MQTVINIYLGKEMLIIIPGRTFCVQGNQIGQKVVSVTLF
jgi:hypothetical protein